MFFAKYTLHQMIYRTYSSNVRRQSVIIISHIGGGTVVFLELLRLVRKTSFMSSTLHSSYALKTVSKTLTRK